MIISEAPCKIILFGEHSVVYGYPAIASAINLKTYVKIFEKSGLTEIYSKSYKKIWRYGENVVEEYKPLISLLKYFEENYGADLSRGLKIEIDSDVYPGSGLGTSASVAAALTKALFKYIGRDASREEVNRVTYVAEKVAHGKPSGIDNSVAVYGGIIKFVRRGENFDISRIDSPPKINILIIDTGLGRSTKMAVEKVYKLFKKEQHLVEKIFESIGIIAEEAWNELRKNKPNLEKIGTLMNLNHGLLNAIGVSNLKIEEIVNYVKALGALGAKITGAGLGGYVIALPAEENIETIFEELSKRYANVYNVEIGWEGVKVYED